MGQQPGAVLAEHVEQQRLGVAASALGMRAARRARRAPIEHDSRKEGMASGRLAAPAFNCSAW